MEDVERMPGSSLESYTRPEEISALSKYLSEVRKETDSRLTLGGKAEHLARMNQVKKLDGKLEVLTPGNDGTVSELVEGEEWKLKNTNHDLELPRDVETIKQLQARLKLSDKKEKVSGESKIENLNRNVSNIKVSPLDGLKDGIINVPGETKKEKLNSEVERLKSTPEIELPNQVEKIDDISVELNKNIEKIKDSQEKISLSGNIENIIGEQEVELKSSVEKLKTENITLDNKIENIKEGNQSLVLSEKIDSIKDEKELDLSGTTIDIKDSDKVSLFNKKEKLKTKDIQDLSKKIDSLNKKEIQELEKIVTSVPEKDKSISLSETVENLTTTEKELKLKNNIEHLSDQTEIKLSNDLEKLDTPKIKTLDREIQSLTGTEKSPLYKAQKDEEVSLNKINKVETLKTTENIESLPNNIENLRYKETQKLPDEVSKISDNTDTKLSDLVENIEDSNNTNLSDLVEKIEDTKKLNISDNLDQVPEQLSEKKESELISGKILNNTIINLDNSGSTIDLINEVEKLEAKEIDQLSETVSENLRAKEVVLGEKIEKLENDITLSLGDKVEIIDEGKVDVSLGDKIEKIEDTNDVNLSDKNLNVQDDSEHSLSDNIEKIEDTNTSNLSDLVLDITDEKESTLSDLVEKIEDSGEFQLSKTIENISDTNEQTLSDFIDSIYNDNEAELSEITERLEDSSERILSSFIEKIEDTNTSNLSDLVLDITDEKESTLSDLVEKIEDTNDVNLSDKNLNVQDDSEHSLSDNIEKIEDTNTSNLSDLVLDITDPNIVDLGDVNLNVQDSSERQLSNIIEKFEDSNDINLSDVNLNVQDNSEHSLSDIVENISDQNNTNLSDLVEKIEDTNNISLSDKNLNVQDDSEHSLSDTKLKVQDEVSVELSEENLNISDPSEYDLSDNVEEIKDETGWKTEDGLYEERYGVAKDNSNSEINELSKFIEEIGKQVTDPELSEEVLKLKDDPELANKLYEGVQKIEEDDNRSIEKIKEALGRKDIETCYKYLLALADSSYYDEGWSNKMKGLISSYLSGGNISASRMEEFRQQVANLIKEIYIPLKPEPEQSTKTPEINELSDEISKNERTSHYILPKTININPSSYLRWASESAVGFVHGSFREQAVDTALFALVAARDFAEKTLGTQMWKLPGDGGKGLLGMATQGGGDLVGTLTNTVSNVAGTVLSSLLGNSTIPVLNTPTNETVGFHSINKRSSESESTEKTGLLKKAAKLALSAVTGGSTGARSYIFKENYLSGSGIYTTLSELANTTSTEENFKTVEDLMKALRNGPYITTASKVTGYGNVYDGAVSPTIDSNSIWEIILMPYAGTENGNVSFLPSIEEINVLNASRHGVETKYSTWIPFTGFDLSKSRLSTKSLQLFSGEINYVDNIEFTNELRLTIADDQYKSWRLYFERCMEASVYLSMPHKKDYYKLGECKGEVTVIDKQYLAIAPYKNVTFRCIIYSLTPQFSTVSKYDLLVTLKDFSEERTGEIESSASDLNLTFSIVGENPTENSILEEANLTEKKNEDTKKDEAGSNMATNTGGSVASKILG